MWVSSSGGTAPGRPQNEDGWRWAWGRGTDLSQGRCCPVLTTSRWLSVALHGVSSVQCTSSWVLEYHLHSLGSQTSYRLSKLLFRFLRQSNPLRTSHKDSHLLTGASRQFKIELYRKVGVFCLPVFRSGETEPSKGALIVMPGSTPKTQPVLGHAAQ